MAEPLVVIDNVEKRFGDFVAVKSVSLTIDKGEFVAIMGPSGCGKTTMLRMLAGLETPTSGTIRLSGRVMNHVKANERDTPLVWQSLALFPFLNARENVEFGLKMRGLGPAERRKRAMNWLDRVGIAEFAERPVDQLSGGQRQRVALARSLVIEPQMLLLDEPLSALDAHLVIRMQGEILRLQRELGITFVYVTHSQSEAFAMADRVAIMTRGELAQVGKPKDIYRNPQTRFVAEFVGRNNILSGKVAGGEGGNPIVETPAGRFAIRLPAGRSAAQGESITFVVAADLVQVSDRQPSGGNVVPCRLISEEFVGAMVTLFLESQGGIEWKAQVQQRELDTVDLRSGNTLYVSWPAERAHVIAG